MDIFPYLGRSLTRLDLFTGITWLYISGEIFSTLKENSTQKLLLSSDDQTCRENGEKAFLKNGLSPGRGSNLY